MKRLGLPTFSYWRTDTNELIIRVQGGTRANMKRANEAIKRAGAALVWKYEGVKPVVGKEEYHVDIDLS